MVQTAVTAPLTDRLFGMGRKWNGKKFGTTDGKHQGINRFHPRPCKDSTKSGNNSQQMEKEHTFDMHLQPSKLDKKDGDAQQTNSLVLDYTKYQSPLSLWRTMMDEIRIVPLEGDTRVMIGLGYMAWSGGRLNSSPFLLFRDSNTVAPKV